jgi:hypothetical protein
LPPILHQAERHPLHDEEGVERPDPEQHQGMPVEAVGQAPHPGQGQVFLDGQGGDLADAVAPVEIGRGGVVHGVGAPPVVVGSQGQHADEPADPVIGVAGGEIGAVAAIVLDHEQADQEEGRRHDHQQGRPPVSGGPQEPGGDPDQDQRPCRQDEFEQAARQARLAVVGELALQIARRLECHADAPSFCRK